MDEEIFELHADVCRTLSNPKRLKILNVLRDGEMQVSRILEKVGRIGKANLSQHLAVMRQKGVVATRREGNLIYYRISSPKIIQACDLMREVLFEQLEGKGELFLRYGKSAGNRHGRFARPSAHSRSARPLGLRKTPRGTRS
jgi:DNA-binding transcriptional ArsR family regulator